MHCWPGLERRAIALAWARTRYIKTHLWYVAGLKICLVCSPLHSWFIPFLHSPQQTFVGLEDVLKMFSRHVLKTSSTRLQCNNFSSSNTSSRRKIFTLKTSSRHVFKTCLQDVFKTCLQDVLKTYLQDIFKTS